MFDTFKKALEWLAVPLALHAFYIHFWYLRRLHRDRKILENENKELEHQKATLEKEIRKLRDTKTWEALDLVYKILGTVNSLVLCSVCQELLFLIVAPSATVADKHLEALARVIKDRKDPFGGPVLRVILSVLEQASRLTLWTWWREEDLANRPALVSRTLKVYSSLIPLLSDGEMASAIEFCVKSCQYATGDLRKGAALILLPVLLKHRPGNVILINTYVTLFDSGMQQDDVVNSEEIAIVSGLFNDLVRISNVVGPGVDAIWTKAFSVIANIAMSPSSRWDRAAMLLNWWIATEKRLEQFNIEKLGEPEKSLASSELEQLSRLIAEYMEDVRAPSRTDSYYFFAQAAAGIRRAFDPKAADFRPPNRAVPHTPPTVEIIPTGVETEKIEGEALNLSVGDGEWHPGAWVITQKKPVWSRTGKWPATVIVRTPRREPTIFESAEVYGPETYGKSEKTRMYGFRVRFGPPSSGWRELREFAEEYPRR